MATSKPETRYILSIHALLDNIYYEKMANPWRSGTPDVWYSGCSGDLWVEYKFIDHIPLSNHILPNLTPRQANWLNRRYKEGRNVAVILGIPSGGIVYRDKDWCTPLPSSELLQRSVTKREIADFIKQQVGRDE